MAPGSAAKGRLLAIACVLAAIAVGVSACSTGGIHHRVGRGENLYRIGKRYGVPTDVLIRSNRIQDVGDLKVGQRIYIPRRGEMARRSGIVAKRKATPPVGAGNYSALRNRVPTFSCAIAYRAST